MQQQPVQTPQACPASEARMLNIPTSCQGGVAASLLLDATTLSGLLQQPPLESFSVLEAAQQAATSLPASRPGSAGNQERPSNRREQAGPGAAVPYPAACPVAHPATADHAQLVPSSKLQQSLVYPTRLEPVPTQQAPAALPHACSSVVLMEAGDSTQLCHDPSTAFAGIAQAAAATAASSGTHLNPAGTAQGASTSPAERAVAAGEMCSETDDRLKATMQGRGLQQLAALLSEESEMESDFSDDSGSGSGNGSGDGAAHGSSEFSSFLDQDDFAGQPKVQSQLPV